MHRLRRAAGSVPRDPRRARRAARGRGGGAAARPAPCREGRPTRRSTTRPQRKNRSVGMACTPKRMASCGLRRRRPSRSRRSGARRRTRRGAARACGTGRTRGRRSRGRRGGHGRRVDRSPSPSARGWWGRAVDGGASWLVHGSSWLSSGLFLPAGVRLGPGEGQFRPGAAAVKYALRCGILTWSLPTTRAPQAGRPSAHDHHLHECRSPVEHALHAIGGKWKPMILWQLLEGTRRFADSSAPSPRSPPRCSPSSFASSRRMVCSSARSSLRSRRGSSTP